MKKKKKKKNSSYAFNVFVGNKYVLIEESCKYDIIKKKSKIIIRKKNLLYISWDTKVKHYSIDKVIIMAEKKQQQNDRNIGFSRGKKINKYEMKL